MSLSAVLTSPPSASRPPARADELDLDAFLGLLSPPVRPWVQRAVRSLRTGARAWLRALPEQAGGWGSGPGGAWRAW